MKGGDALMRNKKQTHTRINQVEFRDRQGDGGQRDAKGGANLGNVQEGSAARRQRLTGMKRLTVQESHFGVKIIKKNKT